MKPMLILIGCFFSAMQLSAQTMVNTSKYQRTGKSSYFGALVFSEQEYQLTGDIKVDRKILAGGLSYGISSQASLLVQGGLIYDADFKNSDEDGKGGLLGFGANLQVHRIRAMSFGSYLFMNYTTEKYDSGAVDVQLSAIDLHLGAVATFLVSDSLQPYCGLEIIPYSDGEFEVDSGILNVAVDLERDNLLNLKLGINIAFGALAFRPEVILMGEETFVLAISSL
jgi:hypothetical protein